MPAISMSRWIKANQSKGSVCSRGNRWHYRMFPQEKTTPLTSIEKFGEKWPGAREHGYMASSPSCRSWWLHHNPGLVNVSCSCDVCSAVLFLVYWSTEGERRCSGHLEQKIHPLYISLAYVHTFLHKKQSSAILPHHCRCLVPVGQREEVGFTDCVSKAWLNFVAFCLYYQMVPIDIRALHSLLFYTHEHRSQENISVFQACAFFILPRIISSII